MNCIICAIAKLENKYIYEWAYYHLKLGFRHIYIYDNNDVDGELISDVFTNTAISEQITVINVRGKACQQLVVYNHCYYKYDFDWCAFIDIDEFISFNPDSGYFSIEQLIESHKGYNAILLNWKCFGDCDNLLYEDKPVCERFPYPIMPIDFVASQIDGTPENYHIKCIIKSGLNIDWEEEHFPFKNPHIPSRLTGIINAKGVELDNSPWQVTDYSVAYIRHYITMSLEEYSRKAKRGAADSNSLVRYRISRFFRYNKITLKKLMLIKTITGRIPLVQILAERLKWLSISQKWPTAFLFKSFRRHRHIH